MRWHLAIIIALSAVFYFYHLGRPDIITDESSLATRAIGLVDFDFGIEQPTPWQWVDEMPPRSARQFGTLSVPWWMRLSFHDHPPLVFLLQHWSIRLFGENPSAIRIPSALAGIASVIFVYLIGIQLYQRGLPPTVIARSPPKAGDEAISGTRRGLQIATPRRMSGLAMTDDVPRFAALASALLFAFTVNHVWISRIGLQESVLIALTLAATWAFLKGMERPQWFAAAGALLGFAFISKYIALILIPIFGTLILLPKSQMAQRPQKFRFYFLLSIFFFLVVVSPIIIYNIQLYRNFGHFDFQFSMIFKQDVPHWPSRPGQEVLGSFSNRLKTYFPRLVESNSPYFLALSAIGLAAVLWEIIRRRSLVISHWPAPHLSFAHSAGSLVIIFIWLLLFLIFIGPAHRFLTILTPWLALASGYGIARLNYSNILKNLRIELFAVAFAAFAAFVAFEAFYSYNSVIALKPVGERPWTYSYLHRQADSWGFNELEKYLAAELKGKMPETAITFEFPFAQDILQKSNQRGRNQGLETVPLGIVYNDNINLSAQLWVFLRRIAYQGWPVVSAENFLRGGAEEFFRQSGIKQIIFINATEHALQDRTRLPTPDGDIMESQLRAAGANPKEIKDPRGKVVFRIYEFGLQLP